MFLLKLNSVTNESVLKKLYKDLVDYKLYNMTEILFVPNIKEKICSDGVICSYTLVSMKELIGMDWMDVEDIFFDLIDVKGKVIFDTRDIEDSEKIKEILDIATDCGLEFIDKLEYDFTKFSLKEVDDVLHSVLLEIFELPQQYPQYSSKNFISRWILEDDGTFVDEEGKEYGNILNKPIIDIVFRKPSNYKAYKKDSEKSVKGALFTSDLGGILPFLVRDESINEKIEAYKREVFEALKNIEPDNYYNLDLKVTDILNLNNYIKFEDLMKIIEKKENLFESTKPVFTME